MFVWEAWIDQHIESADIVDQEIKKDGPDCQAQSAAIEALYKNFKKSVKKFASTVKQQEIPAEQLDYVKNQLDELELNFGEKLMTAYQKKVDIIPRYKGEIMSDCHSKISSLTDQILEVRMIILKITSNHNITGAHLGSAEDTRAASSDEENENSDEDTGRDDPEAPAASTTATSAATSEAAPAVVASAAGTQTSTTTTVSAPILVVNQQPSSSDHVAPVVQSSDAAHVPPPAPSGHLAPPVAPSPAQSPIPSQAQLVQRQSTLQHQATLQHQPMQSGIPHVPPPVPVLNNSNLRVFYTKKMIRKMAMLLTLISSQKEENVTRIVMIKMSLR